MKYSKSSTKRIAGFLLKRETVLQKSAQMDRPWFMIYSIFLWVNNVKSIAVLPLEKFNLIHSLYLQVFQDISCIFENFLNTSGHPLMKAFRKVQQRRTIKVEDFLLLSKVSQGPNYLMKFHLVWKQLH